MRERGDRGRPYTAVVVVPDLVHGRVVESVVSRCSAQSVPIDQFLLFFPLSDLHLPAKGAGEDNTQHGVIILEDSTESNVQVSWAARRSGYREKPACRERGAL